MPSQQRLNKIEDEIKDIKKILINIQVMIQEYNQLRIIEDLSINKKINPDDYMIIDYD
jgi:wobble nucleotide-excising tRNase